MSPPLKIALAVLAALLCFGAGVWSSHFHTSPVVVGRRVLYYHDPMHPAYKSDKPGIAPDCGMELEPVYADDAAPDAVVRSAPPGTLLISAERLQAAGIRREKAVKARGERQIRYLGRVAVDEDRLYKINATVDGWIRQITPEATTGNFVRKNQTLASYYAPEYLAAQQAYLFAIGALDRFQATGRETETQIALTKANIQQARDSLTVLGMSDLQADEIERTRELTQNIRIVSPTDGFIIVRNISPGQRFERGTEFFRVADLSRVWVVADLFENEGWTARSARTVVARYQGRTYQAEVSQVPPMFDTATRTLKLRLEVANTGLTLRPDMFVDVEFTATFPPAVTVPSDAIVDSGRRKTVFVDWGGGFFEPRAVETGARLGERVVITHGLEAGECVVVAGTFLLDSESRMRIATNGQASPAVVVGGAKGPVCGMNVEPPNVAGKDDHNGRLDTARRGSHD
jgi:Cu(I)/Ag(I) efflux system membrane fusion protein